MIDHKRIREQVLNQIMEHPEAHNQSSWQETCEKVYDKPASPVEIIRSKGCGTNACIDGWDDRNDLPQTILENRLNYEPDSENVFTLDENSQFYITFSLWTRTNNNEEEE